MKKKLFFIMLTILLVVSCKKEVKPLALTPSLSLKKLSTVTTQTYYLDTLSTSIIEGEKGTKIYYQRKDFNLKENEKVTITLKEFYSFEDIFFNNIQTITNKNELLESSGVLYINAKSNQRIVNLKEGAFLKIKIPTGLLKDVALFSGKMDSLQNIEWYPLKESKALTNDIVVVEKRGNITIEFDEIDTTGYIKGDYYKADSNDKIEYDNKDLVLNTLLVNKLNWINLDKYIDSISYTSFELETNRKDIPTYIIYSLYENINGFATLYNLNGSLKFNKVPYLKDKTYIIMFGFKGNKMYTDKVRLTENKKIKIHLKEVDSLDIKRVLLK